MSNPQQTHGAFSWSELATSDPDAAVKFYRTVLGWDTETMDMPTGKYTVVKAGGAPVGGIMQQPVPGAPDQWGSYITVDDVDARVKKATANGATLLNGPMDVPGVGRMAAIAAPGGAMVSFIRYEDHG